nr:nucleotidyltransferase substrate binding protein [Rhodomicrobium sp. Az07]
MTLPADNKPRWVYRFDNYSRAFSLLREAIESSETRELSQLEKEGVIQRFEYTWELAWKLLRDYLGHSGVVLDTITPSAVIRAALSARIIEDGDVWMSALDTRNKMSHTYNFRVFEQTIAAIETHFLGIFDALYMDMFARVTDDGADV